MGQNGFWDNPDGAKSVVSEVKQLKAAIEPIQALLQQIEDVRAMHELGEEASDPAQEK